MARSTLQNGILWILLLALAPLAPVAAQEAGGGSEALSEKERARQERIDEYVRKKAERRAAREAAKARREAARSEASNAPAAAASPAAPARERRPRGEVRLPKDLERAQGYVRESPLGEDPSVRAYLDLIDSGEASAQQLGAFGSFLGQNGFLDLAMVYYGTALSVDDRDPLLWLNLGTLHRQAGNDDRAAGAYARALRLDPNNAYAHYNLGAALDAMGKYEEAIEEYKIALTLDPDLGDPATNPQAANNDKLTAVKLMLYQSRTGSAGLPLVELPRGRAN